MAYPSVLRNRLGDEGVAALTEVLTRQKTETLTLVTDRFERRLGEEGGKFRAEMGVLRSELLSSMTELRMELRSDFKVAVADVRADLLKWSFVFWVGQVVAVVGLVSALL